MTGQARHLSGPVLSVKGGVHRQAEFTLPIGQTTVGADLHGSLVVSDAPAGAAFALTWDGRALLVRADGCDLDVDGRLLRRGRTRRLESSCSLKAGDLPFGVALPARTEVPPPSRRGWPGFALGVLMTSGLAASAALLAAPSWPPAAPSFVPAAPATGATASAAPSRSDTASAAARPGQVQARLDDAALLGETRQRLAAGGLDGVTVDLQPDGALLASGRIAVDKTEAWKAVARWFDTRAEGRAVLLDRVAVSDIKSKLQVQAVFTGTMPYLIDGDGQKLFLGSTLPDGSVIQRIESQRVIVKTGKDVVAVRF